MLAPWALGTRNKERERRTLAEAQIVNVWEDQGQSVTNI